MVTKNQQVRPQFGDIYDVSLEPVIGSEIGKIRPALIVSNDTNNQYAGTVTVLPITSQTAKKVYAFEVFVQKNIGGLSSDSRIKADQIRTVDKTRLLKHRGHLPDDFIHQVEKAIKVHLDIDQG
jgi:mRNA interferase MazF